MTALCTTLPDNLRLLLVDDHRIFLDGLSLALSPLSQNLQIHTAHSAAEAEQCLRQHDYDLVLLDLRLPDEPGIELLQRWLARGERTPVAILSASDSALGVCRTFQVFRALGVSATIGALLPRARPYEPFCPS